MKNISILKSGFLILCFFPLLLAAQESKVFTSDVETTEKPWTNLNFYNDPDNFQFLIVSDRSGGTRPGIFKDAVKKINMLYPEFVLSVGDIIQGYTKDTAQIRKEWNEANAIINDLKMPYFYLPGNHDITNQVMAVEWEKRYGRRYYHMVYKNTLFIILDSNDDDEYNLTREQSDFALETIRKNPDVRWTFLLMHHPIWEYNTGGRFEELESALSDRAYTVIAGHEHHYNHSEKHGRNYYILATTGAGSRLRGNYFGEFDHVTWVTMTDEGPAMANLRLDGILPHNVADETTNQLARAMIDNTAFNHVMLCNDGTEFKDGTLYFNFRNNADKPMNIELKFYHQHQLSIANPSLALTLAPGDNQTTAIAFNSDVSLPYPEIEVLQIDWTMKYDIPEYSGFQLSGQYDVPVAPSKTRFIGPSVTKFMDQVEVNAGHPFPNLITKLEVTPIGGKPGEPDDKTKFILNESSMVTLQLSNEDGQATSAEIIKYEKCVPSKATRLRNPKAGLKYAYFEGDWEKIPDFSELESLKTGVINDWLVSDMAAREDQFAVLLTGYFYVPEEGMYVFRTNSDDASRLVIDGEVVVNQDLDPDRSYDVGAIALEKGYHPVSIHYLERFGNERLRIYLREVDGKDWKFLELENNFYHK